MEDVTMENANSVAHSGSGTGDDSTVTSERRDEVKEVRKVARRDTMHVVVWRTIATVILLLTAVAVTLTTFFFLKRQHTKSFETLFEQFARTCANAALDKQRKTKIAYRGLADTISTVAKLAPGEWPFVTIPSYESYARQTIDQSNIEIVTMFTLVQHDQREEWIQFTNQTHAEIIEEAHMIRWGNLDKLTPAGFKPFIFAFTPEGPAPDIERDYYFANLHFAPAPASYGLMNWNVASDPQFGPLFENILEMKTEPLISVVRPYSAGRRAVLTDEEHDVMHAHVIKVDPTMENPHSFIYTPVHEHIEDPESRIVAMLGGGVAWDEFMVNLFPKGVNGITVVFENTCNQEYTYEINGPTVTYFGEGDFHETKYDDLVVFQDLTEGLHSHPLYTELTDHCRYSLRIYPSSRFADSLDPFVPTVFAIVVASTFLLVVVAFYVYDLFVQRRNEKLIDKAAQSNAIVSSLFPSNIRDRLMDHNKNPSPQKPANQLKNYMTGTGDAVSTDSQPLADLFLESTIIFADIAGFTAWSSVREPSQVFMLLEQVYGAFDRIAKTRRVYKVETVGDCYVAATGIPEFRKDHAVLMVRFARDSLARMNQMTKELETTLGPDTGDLLLRVGIHTGPVTAGVLRGERARFQLFGDTMNVCSRIESTGIPGRIHVSSETAESLRSNGKNHWLIKRDKTVEAKGKGELQTYWIAASVQQDGREGSSTFGQDQILGDSTHPIFQPERHAGKTDTDDDKVSRLVEWNVEMLSQILKQIVAHRRAQRHRHVASAEVMRKRWAETISENFTPLNEVEEIIVLPEFDARVAKRREDPERVSLSIAVTNQLRQYVENIAAMYRDNSFHNFEHASHVTMSVIKLLSRIFATSELQENSFSENEMPGSIHATLHDHTYGITSDPLTKFSCAFAAMIHDVDHTGVPNTQLIKEKTRISDLYGNRSVAEQNSLVLAWETLMMDDYDELRSAICSDQAELDRFRQLVVNTVMATDIVDKDLKALRNGRWDKAFSEAASSEDETSAVNRKATIVIEHLIQASDVAHTMQHWHVYRKWNEKFFRECYAAYLAGRADKDPSEGWYQGELGFFDFYIIPLAKKLKDCGVFGKSSDEYLTYAVANRREWERRGEEVIREMTETLKQDHLHLAS